MAELEIYYNEAMYKIEVSHFYAGQDAVLHRLPENCTPAEYAEIEFEVLEVTLQDYEHDPDLVVEDDEDFIELAIAEMIKYLIEGNEQ